MDTSAIAAPRLCINCDAAILSGQNYCPACGQKTHPERLTLHEIGEEFLHAMVHVDRSALSLIWQLLARPGVVAREYVSGKRKRYFGPFAFLVVSVAFTSAVIAISGFQAVSSDNPNRWVDFLQRHVNLMFFLAVPLIAAYCRVIGFRERFNYAEYLVLASYTSGMHILYYAFVQVPVWYFLRSHPVLLSRLYMASLPIGPLYFAYAFYQFLPGRRFSAAFMGLLASLLTEATTYVLVIELLSNFS